MQAYTDNDNKSEYMGMKKKLLIVKLEDFTREEKNTSLAAKGALAHRIQRRTACKIQYGPQGAPKWPTGSGKVSTPRVLGILSNFP